VRVFCERGEDRPINLLGKSGIPLLKALPDEGLKKKEKKGKETT